MYKAETDYNKNTNHNMISSCTSIMVPSKVATAYGFPFGTIILSELLADFVESFVPSSDSVSEFKFMFSMIFKLPTISVDIFWFRILDNPKNW